MPDLTELGAELKEFTGKASDRLKAQDARLLIVEQALTAPRGSSGDESEGDIGAKVIHSEEWKNFAGTNRKTSGQISVGSFHKSNLINATGLNQPLVPPYYKPGSVRPG